MNVTQADFGILTQMTTDGGLKGGAKKALDNMLASGNGGLNAASEAKLTSLFNSRTR